MARLPAVRAQFSRRWGESDCTNRPLSSRDLPIGLTGSSRIGGAFFYWLTRLTFGTRIEPTQFELTQWVFLRVLALIYAIAFASLAGQVLGLIGSNGISPAAGFLGRLAGNFGPMRFVAFPSLFWWNSSDAVLRGGAFLGIGLAAVLFFGYAQRVMLALLYVLYLSYSFAGQEFLTFQWDSLLLEAGFLAIFFGRSDAGMRTVGWLYRWLVFRLFFIGVREVGEPRSYLGELDGAEVSLSHAASAYGAGLVCG